MKLSGKISSSEVVGTDVGIEDVVEVVVELCVVDVCVSDEPLCSAGVLLHPVRQRVRLRIVVRINPFRFIKIPPCQLIFSTETISANAPDLPPKKECARLMLSRVTFTLQIPPLSIIPL